MQPDALGQAWLRLSFGDEIGVIMNVNGFFISSFLVVLGACSCSSPQPPLLQTRASAQAGDVRLAIPKTDPAAAELAENLVRKGKRQLDRGSLDSALQTLEKAVQVDPNNQKAWYFRHRVQESIYQREREERYRRDLLQQWRSLRDLAWLGAEPMPLQRTTGAHVLFAFRSSEFVSSTF